MPNLMITNCCNLSCDYCFGIEQMPPRAPAEYMSRVTFSSLLAWLKRSKVSYFHLMGGEPTRHPDFLRMLEESTRRGFTVDVFSNGITDFSAEEMRRARRLSNHWVINLNDPRKYPARSRARLEALLKILGKSAVLTFNIMNTDHDPACLFGYINSFKLQRIVKIGIALPTLNKANVHARPGQFRALARSVVELSARFRKERVKASFECGVPYCFFTEGEKKTLAANGLAFSAACCSILDILPDGNVIYCLPLAALKRLHYKDFPTYQKLQARMQAYYRPYRAVGFQKRCLTCGRKSECNGSCLARIIQTFDRSSLPGAAA